MFKSLDEMLSARDLQKASKEQIENIDDTIKALKSDWRGVPDWRFGQFFCNLERYIANTGK